MTKRRWFFGVSAAALLLITAALVPLTIARQPNVFEQLDLLVDIRHEIVREYVEMPDQGKMVESAARAMIESLDDPYTIYLTPEELKPFDNQIRGTFSGIGAEVDLAENHLRIITPLEGSPAWKAGVMAGDLVLEIDGKTTEGMSISDAVNRLQGPEGATVTIKVRHLSGEEVALPIVRAQINVQTVKGMRRDADQHWDFMLDEQNKIGYVRVTQFTDNTSADVKAALEQLRDHGVKAMILDLRFNPGGLLESAVEISDMFLSPGKRVVSVKGRAVPERVTMSDNSAILPDTPLVVLANEASASAAEIVTGALADNHRATFIGTRTFGKGSVQQVRMLESGQGAIKLTNAYYYLPSGRNIHRRAGKDVWGVDPDDGFYVPMTPEQRIAMSKIRRDGDVLGGNHNATQPATVVTPQWVEKDLADPQLAAAFKATLGYVKDNAWPKVGLSNAQALAVEARRSALTRQRDLLNERLTAVEKELGRLDAAATQPSLDVKNLNGSPATQPALEDDDD